MKILLRPVARLALHLSALNLMVGCSSAPLDEATAFHRDSWREDYALLKTWLAGAYVNLDDSLLRQRVNVNKLDAETIATLGRVHTNEEARRALVQFIETFNDPHLRVASVAVNADSGSKATISPDSSEGNDEPEFLPPSSASVSPDLSAEPACALMGFQKHPHEFHFGHALDERAGEREFQVESFPALAVRLDEHARLGVIRLGKIAPIRFFNACVHEWPAYRKRLQKMMPTARSGSRLPPKGKIVNGTCDAECQAIFIHQLVENRLFQDFQASIRRLQNEHVAALVIDVTDSNEEAEWATVLPGLLTDRKLECGSYEFSRSAATSANLRAIMENDQFQLEAWSTHPPIRDVRVAAERSEWFRMDISELQWDLMHMELKCDRAEIWQDPSVASRCPLNLRHHVSRCQTSSVYSQAPGLYRGPLFVLVNRRTGRAATDFVARLHDSRAAVIIGEKTLGAGCGNRSTGVTTILPHSGLKVYAPDCARDFTDGTNEIGGIEPQIPLAMSDMSAPTFLEQLKLAVRQSLGNKR